MIITPSGRADTSDIIVSTVLVAFCYIAAGKFLKH